MLDLHARVFTHGMDLHSIGMMSKRVDMHGAEGRKDFEYLANPGILQRNLPIGTLRRNIVISRIPCNPLNIIGVLRNGVQ